MAKVALNMIVFLPKNHFSSKKLQNGFETLYVHPETNCLLKNSKVTLQISVGQAVLELLFEMCQIILNFGLGCHFPYMLLGLFVTPSCHSEWLKTFA